MWAQAEDEGRRVLTEKLAESITVFRDHLEVKVTGALVLNVLYREVGLRVPEIVGVRYRRNRSALATSETRAGYRDGLVPGARRYVLAVSLRMG